jgi:cellulose synthase (UDP-forming)
VVSVLLVVSAVVGLARLAAGLSEPIGTLVNVAWVAFDITVMSILVRAVLYKGFEPDTVPAEGLIDERKSSGT